MAQTNFSLEINKYHTRLAHLSRQKDKLELLSLGYDVTTENFFDNLNDAVAKKQAIQIKNLYTKLHLTANSANVVIPDSRTYSQITVMPDLDEQELVKAIHLQADEFIPLPIEEVFIDLITITKLPDNKQLILMVAVQKILVEHLRKTLAYAEIEAASLENELSSTARFTAEVLTPSKSPYLLINLGYEGSSIYIYDPTINFFRTIRNTKIGLDLMLRDMKINLDWSDDKAYQALGTIGLSNDGTVNLYAILQPIFEELIQEIEKTILQIKQNDNITIGNIYTFNYDCHIAHLQENIQKRISIPTQSFPLGQKLIPNPVVKSFTTDLSSFLSVISTHLR